MDSARGRADDRRVAPPEDAAQTADARTAVLRLDAGTSWSVVDGTVIGRRPPVDVVLDAPEVSRRHARIEWRDGAWWVVDLESTNGTFVGGERVSAHRLAAYDVVEIGGRRLEFLDGGPRRTDGTLSGGRSPGEAGDDNLALQASAWSAPGPEAAGAGWRPQDDAPLAAARSTQEPRRPTPADAQPTAPRRSTGDAGHMDGDVGRRSVATTAVVVIALVALALILATVTLLGVDLLPIGVGGRLPG